MPEELPDPQQWYLSDDQRRKVQKNGQMEFRGKRLWVGEGFGGHTIALRPLSEDQWEVWFGSKQLGVYDICKEMWTVKIRTTQL